MSHSERNSTGPVALPHAHSHGIAHSHPAQQPAWSALRMPLAARISAAAAASAALWTIVLLAMR